MTETTETNDITFGSKMDKYVPTRLKGNLPRYVLGTKDAPLRAPFGISTPYAGSENDDRRTFDIEVDEETEAWVKSIDETVLATAIKRSVEWFGKPLEEAVLRERHTRLLQESRNGHRPTVRTKFSLKRDKETRVFVGKSDTHVRLGSKADITRNAAVCLDVRLSSVMLMNKSFSVSLECDQVLVVSSNGSDDGRDVSVFGNLTVVEE